MDRSGAITKKILREKFRPKKFLYFHNVFTVKNLKFCLIFVLIFTHFNSIFYPIFHPISYIPLILIKSLPNFYSYIPHIFYHPSHQKITSIKILSIFKKTLIWSAKMAKIAKKTHHLYHHQISIVPFIIFLIQNSTPTERFINHTPQYIF